MTRLIFATNNPHKVEEIQAAIGSTLEVISLKQAGIEVEIPEPYDTLQENAAEKARVIYQLTGSDCFSEDTGLETEALAGAPGVHSARYAGQERSFEANMEKLLAELEGKTNRKARFRTVISLMLGGRPYFFEGICEGQILTRPRGDKGFGYDPVFQPLGSPLSFAQMSLEEKNRFSHRRKAAEQLVAFLRQQQSTHPQP